MSNPPPPAHDLALASLAGRIGEPLFEYLARALDGDQDHAPESWATLPLAEMAAAMRRAWSQGVVESADGEEIDRLSERLTRWADHAIRAMRESVRAPFDVIALAGYGCRDLSVHSDLDVLLLTPRLENLEEAEDLAREWVAFATSLRQFGVPLELDVRVRSDRSPGQFVRTYEGLRLYQVVSMGMAERFALGQARLVAGSEDAIALLFEAAYGQPLTPERLDELLRWKLRLETELVSARHARRHIRFGIGGLSDAEWLVRLHEMRYPTAAEAGRAVTIDDRLRAIARAGLLNALELDTLLAARRHLTRVRTWIAWMGFTPNVLPENPDRLDRLGREFGCDDGNEFLAIHESVIESVRAIYNEGVERLLA